MPSGHSPPGAIGLLRENVAFRRLWIARSMSFIGDSLGLVALLLHVASTAGSGTAVALLLLVGDFAPTLLCPFSGTLSDRLDRKRLMICSELGQGAIVGTIALVSMPLAPLLALVALRSTLAGIFQPASRSAVTTLVPANRLESANAALGFGTYGFELVGPLAGALLLPVAGIRGMLLIDALTFLLSALLLSRLPGLPPVPLGSEPRLSFLRDAHQGVRAIWSIRPLRILTIGFCAAVAFSAADDVALVFLAQGPLGGGEAAASLLYAGAGVGLLLGFGLVAGFGGRVALLGLLLAGFAIASGGNLLTGLAWSVPTAFGFQAVRGLGISMLDVGVNTLVQRIVAPGMQGRAFANLYGLIGLSAGVSYVAGGPLLDATGPRVLLIVAGIGGLAATAWMAVRLPRAVRDHT
jgi:MFS family permease